MSKIPKFLKKHFWDVNISKLDREKHAQFIIERVLEYGDKKAIKWLEDNFKRKKIKEVLCKSKNLSQKSANFWQIILNVGKDKVLCLKESFRKKHRKIWKY